MCLQITELLLQMRYLQLEIEKTEDKKVIPTFMAVCAYLSFACRSPWHRTVFWNIHRWISKNVLIIFEDKCLGTHYGMIWIKIRVKTNTNLTDASQKKIIVFKVTRVQLQMKKIYSAVWFVRRNRFLVEIIRNNFHVSAFHCCFGYYLYLFLFIHLFKYIIYNVINMKYIYRFTTIKMR